MLNALNNDPCHHIMIHLSLQEKILITKVTSLLWNRTTAPHHHIIRLQMIISKNDKSVRKIRHLGGRRLQELNIIYQSSGILIRMTSSHMMIGGARLTL